MFSDIKVLRRIQLRLLLFLKQISPDIDEVHAHAEDHVHDAEDDGQLHLERVLKYNLVASERPDRVYTQDIGSLQIVTGTLLRQQIQFRIILCISKIDICPPTGSEYVKRFREHVVVDQTAVDGEETH